MADTALLTKELENCSVVSFDVFDTLLMRLLWRPEDVFRLVAQQLNDPSFVKKRIIAEQKARSRAAKGKQHEDINIDEIYSELELDDGKEFELEIERVVCVCNPDLVPVLKEARELGKKIIAISDMYLPEVFVRELLDNAGFEDVEMLFVSSEVRKTKRSGRLFSHMLEQLGVAPQDVLHIGDDLQADVISPRNLGIGTFHYPTPQVQVLQSCHTNPAVIRSMAKRDELEASLLAGLVMRRNLQQKGKDTDYWYNTGFYIAGPLAYSFTAWIAERAQALKLDGLFFLSGDCSLPWKVYRTHFSNIALKYTHASIRPLIVPEIEILDYLKSVGFIDAKHKAIVDIGWQGSAQLFFDKLSIDTEKLSGLYFGMSERDHTNNRTEGYAFNGSMPTKRYTKILKCAEYYDLLFSADSYSGVETTDRKGDLASNSEECVRHGEERRRIAQQIQRGVLDFCAEYIERAQKLGLGDLTPDLAIAPADSVLTNPTSLDVRMVGGVYHTADDGPVHYRPIIAAEKLSLLGWIYSLVASQDRQRFVSYWKIGARRKHQIFGHFGFNDFIFKKTLWLAPKIRKARILGVYASFSAVIKMIMRRLL